MISLEINVSGCTLRIYEIYRSVQGPSLNEGSAVYVESGQSAVINVNRPASQFLWYKPLPYYDSTIGAINYTIDTSASAHLATTYGVVYDSMNLTSSFETGILNNDTVFMVRSVRNICDEDTSVPVKMFVKILEGGPLNISLKDFSAQNFRNGTLLNWRVSDISKIKAFQVEKSIDGTNWQILNTLNSMDNFKYEYFDGNLNEGNNYYRIRIIYHNDQFELSKVESLLNSSQFLYAVYPNPASETLMIQTNAATMFTIFDVFGNVVEKGNINSNNKALNVSSWKGGNYFLHLQTENEFIKTSFSIIK